MMDLMVILDRSGSMNDGKADHEGGLRAFVRQQREAGQDARLTFVQFNSEDRCQVVFDRIPLAEIDEAQIVLRPSGGTPLCDAIGRAVTRLAEKQIAEPSGGTLVLVVTDGQENASLEWSREQVRGLIAGREREGWVFSYLGANVDAFAEGAAVGMASATVANYRPTQAGISAAYFAATSNVLRARTVRQSGGSWADTAEAMSYTSAQRATMAAEPAPQATGATVSGTAGGTGSGK